MSAITPTNRLATLTTPGTHLNDCAREVAQGALNGVAGGVLLSGAVGLLGVGAYRYLNNGPDMPFEVSASMAGTGLLCMGLNRAPKIQFAALRPQTPQQLPRQIAYTATLFSTFAGIATAATMAASSLFAPVPPAAPPTDAQGISSPVYQMPNLPHDACKDFSYKMEKGRAVMHVPRGCKMT